MELEDKSQEEMFLKKLQNKLKISDRQTLFIIGICIIIYFFSTVFGILAIIRTKFLGLVKDELVWLHCEPVNLY